MPIIPSDSGTSRRSRQKIGAGLFNPPCDSEPMQRASSFKRFQYHQSQRPLPNIRFAVHEKRKYPTPIGTQYEKQEFFHPSISLSPRAAGREPERGVFGNKPDRHGFNFSVKGPECDVLHFCVSPMSRAYLTASDPARLHWNKSLGRSCSRLHSSSVSPVSANLSAFRQARKSRASFFPQDWFRQPLSPCEGFGLHGETWRGDDQICRAAQGGASRR